MRQKKKRPEDYPSLTFRLPKDTNKAALERKIERALTKVNAGLDPKVDVLKHKNYVIYKALEIGLDELMKS